MFDLRTFTLVHVVISLLALVFGIAMLLGLARRQPVPGLTGIFLVLAFLTSATGFGFPFEKILPSHVFGVLSLAAITAVIVARYRLLVGLWLPVYALGLTLTVYLDAFVAAVQAFLKIPALNALAPTMESPPFAIAQGLLLIGFVLLGRAALRGLRAQQCSGQSKIDTRLARSAS